MPQILKLACVVTLSLSLSACSAKDDVSEPSATSKVEATPQTDSPKPVANPKNAMGFDADLSLRENLKNNKELRFMTQAMRLAHPSGMLGEEYTNLTLFAPGENAFRQMPEDKVHALRKPENRSDVYYLVAGHAVPGSVTREDILAGLKSGDGTYNLATIRGTNIKFTMNGEDIIVSNNGNATAKILISNGKASDGYVHLIDTVLEPK